MSQSGPFRSKSNEAPRILDLVEGLCHAAGNDHTRDSSRRFNDGTDQMPMVHERPSVHRLP